MMRADGMDDDSVALMRRRPSTGPHESEFEMDEDVSIRGRRARSDSCCNPANIAVLVLTMAGMVYAIFLAWVLIVESGQDAYQRTGNDGFHELFLTIPNNRSAAQHLRNLTMKPHVAGTPENHELAKYVEQKFREYGLTSHIRSYHVLLSYPISHHLSLQQPISIKFSLDEPEIAEDSYTKIAKSAKPFHGYSASGIVEGVVVYANFGRTEDFQILEKLGVEVKGNIVIVRYGNIYRGDKVANAEERGATGVLIYSDPEQYAHNLTDKEYPESRWLPKGGVQRGSVYLDAGDPLTPGWPSVAGGEYFLTSDKRVRLPKIPSLPISRDVAQSILFNLGGHEAPREWWGTINIDAHHLGPGPSSVELGVEMNETFADIHNVFGVVEGTDEPDRYVLLGNHRDAWVYGAADPNSGTAALLEVARSIGKLMHRGWKPRRTIILCSWDAEEYGLIGSTEWVEENEDMLSDKAIAYLNVDTAVSGSGWSAGATPQLDRLLFNVTTKVIDPDNKARSLYDSWVASATTLTPKSAPPMYRLGGGGTDFAAFLQHVGVPGTDFFFGPDVYPVYHSIYDNFNWMKNFGDPQFLRHVAAARVWGLLGLRLADDAILQFDYADYAHELLRYTDQLDERFMAVNASSDLVSTAPLRKAIEVFKRQATVVNDEIQQMMAAFTPKGVGEEALMAHKRRHLNDRLMQVERSFLEPEGLPGRSWYKHLVYGPMRDNGYGSLAFPGVYDAIANAQNSGGKEDWGEVQHQIHRVARAITRSALSLRGTLT